MYTEVSILKKLAFDNEYYLKIQRNEINKRINSFGDKCSVENIERKKWTISQLSEEIIREWLTERYPQLMAEAEQEE